VNSHSFENNLAEYQKRFAEQAARFFDDVLKRDKLQEEEKRLCEYVQRGGKRLRGYLTCLGYRLITDSVPDGVFDFSLGIEFGHAALLIQDDIFDEDKIRRSKNAFHITSGADESAENHSSFERTSVREAIVLSNILITHAYDIMLTSSVPPDTKMSALSYLNSQAVRAGVGEFKDITIDSAQGLTQEDVALLVDLKTTSYSLNATLVLGAHMAGASPKTLESLKKVSYLLGQLYQMTDDYLSVLGESNKTGKGVSSDLSQKKATYVTLLLRNRGMDSTSLDELKKSDILAIQQEISCLAQQYRKDIDTLLATLDFKCTDELRSCIDFISNRSH